MTTTLRDGRSAEQRHAIVVTRLMPGEDRVLRSAWLHALRDSPARFTASRDEEAGRPRSYWRQQLEFSTWIVAREGDRVVGLARMISAPQDEDSGWRYIERVWVDKDLRRQGILRLILAYLEDLARGLGVQRLRLWVLEDNEIAQDAYLKLGFEFGLDDRQTLEKAPERFELRMNKSLT